MSRTGRNIFLALLAAAIIAIILFDFNSKSKKKKGNPYAYDIEQYKTVDPSLINYKETRNIPIKSEKSNCLYYANEKLYIGADQYLQVISTNGTQFLKIDFDAAPRCLYVEKDEIYIGFRDHIRVYDQEGQLLQKWDTLGYKTVLTSLAVKDDMLFAADAGNRRIVKYSKTDGQLLGEFKGKTKVEAIHGFIIPSPYFEVAVNEEGELWVVNPGKHSFENYNYDGGLRAFWEKSSPDVDGFSGCCNPAQMALMPDGSFLTAEKGLVRIKIHKPSGELDCVVAPPTKFKEDGHAPDLAVSPDGTIYALDFDKNRIRIFERKK